MRNLTIGCGLAAVVLALGAAPSQGQTYYPHHHHHHHYRYADQECARSTRRAANTGTIVGGVGGALVGNALGGGHLAGTLIGGGVGAVAGHEIARNNHRC